MNSLEQQAAELSNRLTALDRSAEQLRQERSRVYRKWVECVQGIADTRNREERCRQPQYHPAEGADHHGHINNPFEEDKAHAN
jgi:hypothetical protein